MGWLKFISSIVSSISWPLVLIVVMVIFKAEFRGLLRRIKKVKHGKSEVDLETEVSDALKEVDALNFPSAKSTPDSEKMIRLAKDSPRGAILDSWLTIEEAILEFCKRHGIKNDARFGPYHIIRNIRLYSLDHNVLGEGLLEMLSKLREIRNDAVHRPEAEITTEVAIEYAQLTNRVKARLEEG